MGIMDPSDACITTHLPPVGVDDPDVVLVHLEVQQLLDVVKLTRLTGGELCCTPHKNVVSDNSQCLEKLKEHQDTNIGDFSLAVKNGMVRLMAYLPECNRVLVQWGFVYIDHVITPR